MKIFRAFVLILAGAILLPAPSFGDNKNKRRIVPPTRKGAASELPTIRKVGGDSVTVGKKTYKITSFTRIMVNGRKATLGDLKAGMQVELVIERIYDIDDVEHMIWKWKPLAA